MPNDHAPGPTSRMTAVVIAHRTCPRHEAENSLAGIARAGALGADAVEVDVRLTRDGVPVLVHDRTLLRIAGWPLPTRWLSFDRVRNLVRRDDGLQIPTFEEALNALPTGVMMTIDVKEDRAASAVIDLVRGQYEDRVWLWTRTPSISSRFREALPDVARALLRDVNSPEAARQLIEDAVHSGANMISPPWDQITRDFVADAQGRGLKVVAMAENAESQASKLAAGLDGIVTNWPEEALAVRSGTE